MLDELTAEVMKINISPEMVTAEMTVKLKMPSMPGQTYRAEAKITDVQPPKVTIEGVIKTLKGEEVATARAICVMMDKMPKRAGSDNTFRDPEANQNGCLTPAQAAQYSLSRQAKEGGGGDGRRGSVGDVGGTSVAGNVRETIDELRALQGKLVAMLQSEYFCDDLEPPPDAFGWNEQRLRDYFESGGD